jgi:hypothetical protein
MIHETNTEYSTDLTAPNCITEYFYYDSEVTGFDCGNSDDLLTQSFYTTADNTTVPSITIFNAYYSAPVGVTSAAPASSSLSPLTTSPSPSPSPSHSPSPNPSPSPTPTSTPAPSPTPIGAIVGGAVGGVVAIAIVGLILFFLLRRNKKQKDDPQQQYPVVAPMQQTQGPPPPQFQQMYPQQPQQPQYQYPSPSSGQLPAQTYPVAGYQTAYPEKTYPQESAYPVYGSPQLSHNEPAGSGPERMSAVPPYSPQPSSAGVYDSKNNMAINPQGAGLVHELGEQNRYDPVA